MKKIYLVIPCYNEEEVLSETAKRLLCKMNSLISQKKISPYSKIVFVNDGSYDNTWSIIKELHHHNPLFSGLNLSRNEGHQNALLAGLLTVTPFCDAAVSLDADLQDDIEVIDTFLEKFSKGCDIVYGVRTSRHYDTLFKKWTAQTFYKFLKKMGVEIIYNHADYRLMSQRALLALAQFKEVNLFLRGLIPMIGYQTDTVTYERKERFAGKSKYPFRKMVFFSIDGITSFSMKPIYYITVLGFLIFFISILMLFSYFLLHLYGSTVEGWTSIVISIWAMGGLELLSIGIIGQYIGKIYLETKARPRFIVEQFLHSKEEFLENTKEERGT